MSDSIKKIVIVGRDIDAWLSAVVLQLHFRKQNTHVLLVELPGTLCKQDFYSVLPTHKGFHALLGLTDEYSLLNATLGLPVLAQRYSNWSDSPSSFYTAYDTVGTTLFNIDFVQYWLKAKMSGLNVAIEQFSVGAMAAQQGKFAMFENELNSFSNATYGYHLDAIAYIRMLKSVAIRAKLDVISSEIDFVSTIDSRIDILQLKNGEKISADFFIDASGTDGVLIKALENIENYESWRKFFPCDRMIVGSSKTINPYPSFSQITAAPDGWVGLFPLANRTGVRALYSSGYSTSQRVQQRMQQLAGVHGELVESAINHGIRKKTWIGNCIAVGDTAVNLDYLDGVQLHMLHKGLVLLRSLFPVSVNQMPESEIYNERFYAHALDARDFNIAHYALNKRNGDPLWDEVRGKLPDALQEKLNLFSACGQIAMREYQTFQEHSWVSLLIGHGVIPESYNMLVNKIPDAELMKIFQYMLKDIAATVSAMPSLQLHAEMNLTANKNI